MFNEKQTSPTTQSKPAFTWPDWTFWGLALLILVSAGWVRTYNLDWDEGTHLHPDERYLTMVASAIQLPESLSQYWDTENSPLNPTNHNYGNYVYGTLPLFTTRIAGAFVDRACGDNPALIPGFVRWLAFGTQDACWSGTYTGYGGIHLVGRYLSTCADMLALIGLMLLALCLYNRRTALLAGMLYAFAVLPIQHAHFFVVDSFATVFVIWTLYLVARSVVTGKRWSLALAGLTTGLAVSSKISVWPLAGIVALGALLSCEVDNEGKRHYTLGLDTQAFVPVIISGILAALAFRVGQPYAFSGPGFLNVSINSYWLDTMREIRELVNGQRDVPYGHQWAQRTPIIFPWKNMVFWGLGLPLGLTAWVGWAFIGKRLIWDRRYRHLLPWVWGTVFFLYQGTQWVKSMRYLLPIYPVFALFAAWILDYGLRKLPLSNLAPGTWWQRILGRRETRHVMQALTAIVLIGTFLWALGFLQIYQRTVTRIEASRWMYDHIPTAATLYTAEGLPVQVPVTPNAALTPTSYPLVAPLTVTGNGELAYISLNKVSGLSSGGQRTFQVTLATDAGGSQILSRAREEINVPATGTKKIRIDMPPVTLQAGQTLYLIIECPLGEPVMFETSVIANEHWDDGLPLRIDGKDPFSSWYRGLTTTTDGLLHLYDEDTLDKRENLLNWLDETDYIVMSSNRLYGSIPRLPMRYPMTIAYYEALLDGRLGFELLADFSSFPRLGDCQFPDQEIPFELTEPRFTNAAPCSVSYPAAEEAFSVYDHPRVLIFGKTAAYSRENVESLLPPSLLDNVQWMTPLQATRNSSAAAKTLLMDEELQSVQESGGTWSEIFNRKALQNRYPILAVMLWWLLLTALGLLAFPWLYIGLPELKDKGYGLARAAGLLLWAYPAWLLASLRLAPHTRLLLWGIFLLFLCASGLLAYRRKDELLAYWRGNWRNLLTIDVIFTILYLAWTYIRYLNPDLWHPVIGGEKPMDFAYLNAVIKSTWFPPYDPWFSGGIMNYYYFGFVLIGSLAEALGIMPSIAYNLAIPSLFAMTGVGAYSLAQNLSGQSGKRARRAGLWGLLLVLLLGNLGELRLIFKGLEELGDVHIESFIPGYPALVSALVGFWKILVEGQNLLFRPEWWYWDATRVIPYDPGDAGPINEFPLFTFIYADLHAHMMAFPLTQVALGVALQWGLRENKLVKQLLVTPARSLWSYLKSIKPANVVTFFLGALAAGSLRATNTWDYPTYFGLIAVSFILAFFNTLKIAPRSGEEKSWQIYAHLLVPVLMLLTAEVLFRPYTANYATVYGQFSPWKGMKTPLGIYLIMHAQFVVPLLILAVLQSGVILRDLWQQRDINTWLSLGIIGLGMAILMATLLWLGVSIAWLVVPLGTIAALIVLDVGTPVQTRILWFWVGTALFLSLLVEVVVLSGDIGRMNTVFKFYLQVWMLLALAAAVAFERIFTYCFAKEDTHDSNLTDDALWGIFKSLPYSLTDTVLVILSTLLFATALYTFLAIPARVQDRWNPGVPHTLDGSAFIPYNTQYENGGMAPLYEDYRVIKWFHNNVEGNPIIMEAQAEREYLWGNRISIYTGLPSVAAWRWHQVQQRMVMEAGVVERRQFDIKGFYNSAEPAYAYQLLLRNAVDYVVLTSYERLYMLPEGEPKFADMVANGWLEVAYHEGDAFVYKVIK